MLEFKLSYFQLMHGRNVDLSPGKNFEIIKTLLLLARNVAMNSGLFRFPCRVCARPVNSDQRGIDCLQWCHATSENVANYQYQEMRIFLGDVLRVYCRSCLFRCDFCEFLNGLN